MELESLVVRLAMDDAPFRQGIRDLGRSMRVMESEFQRARAGISNFGSSVSDLRLRADYLNRAIGTQSEIVRRYEQRLAESRGSLSGLVQAQEELRGRVESARQAFEESVQTLGETSEQTQHLRESYEALQEEYARGDERIRSNVRAIEGQEIALNQAGRRLNEFQQELRETNEEIERSTNRFSNLVSRMGPFGGHLQRIGGAMTSLGKKMSVALTLPIVGLGKKAMDASVSFESAMAGVRKTVDGTQEDFERLEKSIFSMSEELPSSAVEIAAVMEAAGQLGVPIGNMEKFTRVMIDLGESTNLSADMAATELARFANIVQMPLDQVDRLGSTIVYLGNNLATTEAEIVSMGARLAAAGTQAGLSEAEIMGFAGALSSVGIEAEAGGTAFSKLMIMMQTAVEKGDGLLEEFANVSGMSAEAFSKAFSEDAPTAIQAFLQGLGTMEEKGGSAILKLAEMGIEEVRLRDTVLRAAGAHELFAESIEMANAAWGENAALTKEAQQRYATMESRIEMLKNKLFKAFKGFGDAMAPDVEKVMVYLGKFLDFLDKLSPETKRAIVRIAAAVALIGPAFAVVGTATSGVGKAFSALSGVFQFFATGAGAGIISALPGIFAAIGTALSGAATAIGGFVTAAAPYLAIAAAIVAAGVLIYQNWDEIVSFAKEMGSRIVSAWQNWTGAVGERIASLRSKAAEGMAGLKKAVSEKLTDIGNDFKQAGGGWKGALAVSWGLIKDGARLEWNAIKTVVNTAAKALGIDLSSHWKRIETAARDGWKRISEFMTDPIGKAKEAIKRIIEDIKSFFRDLKLKLPEIELPRLPRLPRLRVDGNFSISPPSVPSFNWYDKGGVFYGPQIIGVGEKRPEFVGALDDLRRIVREESGGERVINHFNLYGVTIREEADIRKIAMEMARLMQEKRRGRGR